MPRIAFFDLDKTLIAVNSATLWVKRELRTGRVSLWDTARVIYWTSLYELGFSRIENAIEDAVRYLSGQEETDMIERVRSFFDEEIEPLIRPGARRAVERHLNAGDVVALLTSSSSYLGDNVAQVLGAQHVLSNRFEVDGTGKFTGKPEWPLCYGPGKVFYAEKLAQELGTDLSQCAFYSDSFADVPVLEKVAEPVAVHPDPRLKRLARERGWPIEVWS